MSTIPTLQSIETPVPGSADEMELQRANQDECVVSRLGAARGMMGGMVVGALLWIGLILAGAALIHR